MIIIPYGWEPALEVYYAERVGLRATIVGIDLHSSADTMIEEINAALARRSGPVRVELLTWFQLPADIRGMYGCLLESAGQRVSTFTVQGVSSTAYTIERPLALSAMDWPVVTYGSIDFAGGSLSGARNVCLQTRWTLQQPTADDWRVSARLVTTDPPGWIIARSDTDIRNDEQVPTSALKPGDAGEAYSLLRFPAGTPPGNYAVQAVVFSEQHPAGLDRLVGGIPAGTSLTLGSVQPVGTTGVLPVERPPIEQKVSLSDGVWLIGHDARGGTLSAGQELRITLHWQAEESCCTDRPWDAAALTLRGDGWRIAQPVAAYSTYSLDWHALVVPAEAVGPAKLVLEVEGREPVVLADYVVEATDRLFAPPAYDIPVVTAFPGVAVLEGLNVKSVRVSPGEALELTLVWHVAGTPERSYRVFTHLLNDAGRVIAQHDSVPVAGDRPTTSWVRGEYIVDPYALVFNEEGRLYQGAAYLEVGFYDPETGQRVVTASGADHIVVPVEITVE